VGSNILSDKYTRPAHTEETFSDFALFVAHTGFSNIRKANKSDADIIPIFRSVGTLVQFLRRRSAGDDDAGITCGFTFNSLDVAWQIYQTEMLLVEGTDKLWYILDEMRFVLFIRNTVTKNMLDVITDQDIDHTLDSMNTTFRPVSLALSIDSFICRHILHHVQEHHRSTSAGIIDQQHCDVYMMTKTMMSSTYIYTSLYMIFPRYMRVHELSRTNIANRILKLRRLPISSIMITSAR
jgi:hypothetical protein